MLKREWTEPGHRYRLVAVHGFVFGEPMRPGHRHVVNVPPNEVWTTELNLFTSNTPVGAPMTLTVADLVTHNLWQHEGEFFPWGPYVVTGPALLPPPGGLGVSFGVNAGGQLHPGPFSSHLDLSAGVVAATYGGSVDTIEVVLYVEAGIHDPPPGCTALAAECSPANVVPPSGSSASGGAAATIHLLLGDNEFAVTVAVLGIQPPQVLSTDIRLGHPGENGPLILSLPGPWTAVTSDVSMVGFQGTFPQQYVQDLLAGRTYVQANTASFPQGAVRGQLIAPPLYSNSGDLSDPYMVTRAGGHCSVNGDATDLQTTLGLNILGFGAQAPSNNAVADDFVVPPGQSWIIHGIVLDLYQTQATSPTITSIDYAFSETDLLGQPQPTWTTVSVTPAMTRTFRKLDVDQPSAGCDRRLQEVFVPLAEEYIADEGRHWLTWRASGSAAYTGPWQMPVVVPGQSQRPGANAMGSAGGQPYAYVLDTASQTQQDFVFQLAGFTIGQRLPFFADNFDTYPVNGAISVVGARNGWSLWSPTSPDATVSDVQRFSLPHAMKYESFSDVVQTRNVLAGKWELTAMTWFAGGQPAAADGFIIGLNTFPLGPPPNSNNYSMQIRWNPTTGRVRNDHNQAIEFTPIVYNAWIPFRAQIDLTAATYSAWYNNVRFINGRSWPNGVASGGANRIQCFDFYSGGTNAMWVDDVRFAEVVVCPGDLNGDSQVGLSDLVTLLAAFGSCSGGPGFNAAADFDTSGCIDLGDLALLLANFGSTCP